MLSNLKYRLRPILVSVPLMACEVGLQIDGSLKDSGLLEEPSFEPSSPSSEPDAALDDTEDTLDTNDTTTDTSDPSTLIPTLISEITPLFGNTTGGDTITITGGPFASDASVTFGGYNATILSNNGTQLRVTTPRSTTDGAVEVRVNMSTGYGISENPFLYFEDALGKTSAIGVISKIEYVGNYWENGTPASVANMWTAFVLPTDFHVWQFNTAALNQCERNGIDADGDGYYDDINGDGQINSVDYYQYSGSLQILDIGANTVTLTGNSPMVFSRSSNDPTDIGYYMYESGSINPSSLSDNAYYDLTVSEGIFTDMAMAQYARASKRLEPSSPSLNTSSLQSISRTQNFSWTPSGADWIEIRMFQRNADGNIHSDVICNVNDSGSFTMVNKHHTWSTGGGIYIQFTRVYESDEPMPHNDGSSRVVGAYTIFGAGFMN